MSDEACSENKCLFKNAIDLPYIDKANDLYIFV